MCDVVIETPSWRAMGIEAGLFLPKEALPLAPSVRRFFARFERRFSCFLPAALLIGADRVLNDPFFKETEKNIPINGF
ncbi:MAG: hypothetical protein IMW86_03940 [Hydrogenibacillus sp.]|nr:hypothetical protein [Hydrogenibacillus sp.]